MLDSHGSFEAMSPEVDDLSGFAVAGCAGCVVCVLSVSDHAIEADSVTSTSLDAVLTLCLEQVVAKMERLIMERGHCRIVCWPRCGEWTRVRECWTC